MCLAGGGPGRESLGSVTCVLLMSLRVTRLGLKLITWFSAEQIVLYLASSVLVWISGYVRLVV